MIIPQYRAVQFVHGYSVEHMNTPLYRCYIMQSYTAVHTYTHIHTVINSYIHLYKLLTYVFPIFIRENKRKKEI